MLEITTTMAQEGEHSLTLFHNSMIRHWNCNRITHLKNNQGNKLTYHQHIYEKPRKFLGLSSQNSNRMVSLTFT